MFTNTKKAVEDVTIKRGEMGTLKAEEKPPTRFANSSKEEESKGGNWRDGLGAKSATQQEPVKPSGFTRGTGAGAQLEQTKSSDFNRGPATQ